MGERNKLMDQYLEEICRVDLLSPEDEVSRALELARHKRDHWRVLLSYPLAVEPVLDAMVTLLADPPSKPVAKLRGSVRAIVRRTTDTTAQDFMRRVEEAAEALAVADTDGNAVDAIGAALTAYQQVGNFSPLVRLRVEDANSDELCRYLRRVHQTGHAYRFARNAFVKANLRLVVKIANRYKNTQLSLEDLVQEGSLGLMTAVERFDPSRGFRFSTYAGWWIRHTITRAIAKKGRTVRLPVYVRTAMSHANRERQALRAELGRDPTLQEIAARMEMDLRRLERIHEAARTHSVSLQVGPNDDEGYSLEEVLPDTRMAAPGDSLDQDFVSGVLSQALAELAPMEVDILRKRFGLDEAGERTLREVGADYGLSRERIRQLQNKVLDKLRGELNRHGVSARC